MKTLAYLLPLIIVIHTLIGCAQSSKDLPAEEVETVTQTTAVETVPSTTKKPAETAPTEASKPVENTAPKAEKAVEIPQDEKPDQTVPTDTSEQVAVVTTEKGKFIIEFYVESAPVAVENFKKLINLKFYDGLIFHRIENYPGLNIVQGGCPRGDGFGGPGWTIVDEYTNPNQRKHLRGTVAMARANIPNSAGSQFYICLKPQPHLDGQYTTFGSVIQGMDVVDRLKIGDVMTTIRLEAKSKYVKAAEN